MHWEWIFHRSFFRQGCACEACRVLVDYTFAQQNAHRVMPEAYRPGNVSGPYEKAENAPGGPPAPGTTDGNWAAPHLYGPLREKWRLLNSIGKENK